MQFWILAARAERHWRIATQLPDLPPGHLSGLFWVQQCLETYLSAALAQAGLLRDVLKRWFDSLPAACEQTTAHGDDLRCTDSMYKP